MLGEITVSDLMSVRWSYKMVGECCRVFVAHLEFMVEANTSA